MVNSWRVQQAAQAIRAGAVIAYPTEAVWGLGCDPWDEEAVDRLLMIKGRSVGKGLILVADNIRQFDFLFSIGGFSGLMLAIAPADFSQLLDDELQVVFES